MKVKIHNESSPQDICIEFQIDVDMQRCPWVEKGKWNFALGVAGVGRRSDGIYEGYNSRGGRKMKCER